MYPVRGASFVFYYLWVPLKLTTKMENLKELIDKILNGYLITREEAVELWQTASPEGLYEAAHEVTVRCMGNSFDTCSIVNVKSGNCPEDCKWCAQSKHYPTGTEQYALLSPSECKEAALQNRNSGIGRFSLVAGGRSQSRREIDHLVGCYNQIRSISDIKLCASLGLLDYDKLLALRRSGVTTYHCNMETAPSFFASLCSTHTQEQKLQTIREARRAGMQICSGGIIGMGESMEQRIEFALYLRDVVKSFSIPINILQPIKGTPLQHTPPLSEEEYLTTVALFRLINPKAYLRFSGGRAQLSQEVMHKAVYIGINAAITGDMLTTTGTQAAEDMAMIQSMGMVNTNQTDWDAGL